MSFRIGMMMVMTILVIFLVQDDMYVQSRSVKKGDNPLLISISSMRVDGSGTVCRQSIETKCQTLFGVNTCINVTITVCG